MDADKTTVSFPPVRRFLRRNFYSLIVFAFFAALALSFFIRKYSEWEYVYLGAAMRLRAGGDLYDPAQGYLYPPFMALMAVPFTYLPAWLDRAAFFAINVAALIFMVKAAWAISGGEHFQPAARAEQLSFAVGLATALPYCVGAFNHQQTDVLVGAMVMAGCRAVVSERFVGAASCFGVAAAMKCTSLLWLVFFLWHGLPGAALWLLCVAVGLNVLPDLPGSMRRFSLGEWWRLFGAGILSPNQPPGNWGSAIYYNQSIPGTGARLFLTRLARAGGGFQTVSRAHQVATLPLKLGVYGVCAGIALASLAIQPRHLMGGRKSDTVSSMALECGAIVALMVLLSPMSGPPHFAVLMLPGFCAARLGFVGGKRLAANLALVAVATAVLSIRTVVGQTLVDLAMWSGAVGLGALMLLLACNLELLWRRSERGSYLQRRNNIDSPIGSPSA